MGMSEQMSVSVQFFRIITVYAVLHVLPSSLLSMLSEDVITLKPYEVSAAPICPCLLFLACYCCCPSLIASVLPQRHCAGKTLTDLIGLISQQLDIVGLSRRNTFYVLVNLARTHRK